MLTRLVNISLQVEARGDLNHEDLAEPSAGRRETHFTARPNERASAGLSTSESRPSREGIAVP